MFKFQRLSCHFHQISFQDKFFAHLFWCKKIVLGLNSILIFAFHKLKIVLIFSEKGDELTFHFQVFPISFAKFILTISSVVLEVYEGFSIKLSMPPFCLDKVVLVFVKNSISVRFLVLDHAFISSKNFLIIIHT